MLCFAPGVRTIVTVIPKETFEHIRVIISEVFRDDAHLEVRVAGEKISGKVKARFKLIILHACTEDLAKGAL